MSLRHDWTRAEIKQLYQQPLLDLLLQAQNIHRSHFTANHIQVSTLLSIKTVKFPEAVNIALSLHINDTQLAAEKKWRSTLH